MKKLDELEINIGKPMKNEELITLKGGTSHACTCSCYDPIYQCAYGYLVSEDGICAWDCSMVWSGSTGFCGNVYPMEPCQWI